MNELGPLPPELRRALDEHTWPEPPADLVERLLPSLQSSWTQLGAASPATAATGMVSRLFGSAGLWLAGGALVVGGLSGAVIQREWLTPPAPLPVSVPLAAPTPASPLPSSDSPQRADAQALPPAPALPRVKRPASGSVAPEEKEGSSTLLAEQMLLESARTAFLRKQPELAMPALEKYERLYPEGQLREEHAMLKVQGLCLLRRTEEAKAAVLRFHQAFPESIFGDTVDAALARLLEAGAAPDP